jgi:hypothetical protein
MCPGHWNYLDDGLRGQLQTEAGYEAALQPAIDLRERSEVIQARFPTRLMPRPVQ